MIEPLGRLASLPHATLRPARAARIQQRCHLQLARQAQRAARRTARPTRRHGPAWWPAVVASLCVAYVTEVIRLAVDVLGTR